MTHPERFCLTCVWYDVTEAHVLQQFPALCLKHRTVQHADDACSDHTEYHTTPKAA